MRGDRDRPEVDKVVDDLYVGRASILTMRRWGIRWPMILRCLLGQHTAPYGRWLKRCGRCGTVLDG